MTVSVTRPGHTHGEGRRHRGLECRAAVLAAATKLFVRSGYANVGLADIAREAGVDLPSVEAVTGDKAGLLTLLIDEGSHDPIVEWTLEAVRACQDPREAVAKAVHGIRVDNQRYAELVPTRGVATFAQVTARRPPARCRSEQYYRERMGEVADRLAQLDALRPGLDRERVIGILWFYLGHHSWHLCVAEQGWTWAQTEQWLTEQLTSALLGAPPADHDDPRP